MPISLISSVARIIFIGSLLQTSIADVVAPLSITILNTAVTNCDIPISTSISANKTSLDILYDTSKSNGTTPDVLAWTDSTNATETVCTVCTTFKWPSGLYGLITSIDYGYYHRLDEGLLEQVASIITMNNGTSEEYFDFSYIYGDTNTAVTALTHSTQANNSEALLLDFTKPSESVCVQTAFRMYNRVGVVGASGEISRKSVFSMNVNFAWQALKPTRR
ncbi:hypothetical protein K505DRAFT_357905 [Melanomma pulvis-pyrius CBS 109.77]|uniref:Iron reductase domain protein n=1 Tax=Melanomma pulvis-pyrius CBS 109.77 TaxID=1314802 RepID=A0A6A6XPZ0_9PLEO|nr:hypothetical protein K505DRAFT_357905 [Melanomma pulvis-pyrius CBS 109.77]